MIWRPNPGPQTAFLASSAREVLYGGAGGGGKTDALLACPLRWIHIATYRGLYLRREAVYLGQAIDRSLEIYPHLGGRLVRTPQVKWIFPSGATLWMNHCEHDSDVANYDSFQFAEILFDELTHFSERQYRGIRARLRGTDTRLPYWSRAATNPGGRGHEWVFKRFAAWLDPTYERRARPGETRWFKKDAEVTCATPLALSRTFIPARIEDNPHLGQEQYRAQLQDLDPVRRAQVEDGNWLVKPAAGLYFKREWVRVVDVGPAEVRWRVRYWDLAAGGDWAVGVRMAVTESGLFVVEHVVRLIGTPGEVRDAVERTAFLDGPEVPIVVEQDPGQAGKDQVFSYAVALGAKGFALYGRPKRVDKVTAFGPFSAQAQAHNVVVVRGVWNGPYFDVLEGFPEADHDDDVDATSGAHAVLCGAPLTDPTPPEPPPLDPDPTEGRRDLSAFASRR